MKPVCYSTFAYDLANKGLEYSAQHSAALGFGAVELYADCPVNTPDSPVQKPTLPMQIPVQQMRDTLEKHGLQAACYSIGVNLLTADEEVLFQEMQQHVNYAAAIGSPYLHHTLIPWLVRPQGAPGYEQALAAVLPKARRIADMCAQQGLACLYEPQGTYFNGVQGLCGFFEQIRKTCPNTFFCADTGNSLFVNESPSQVFAAIAEHVRHVHIKDYAVLNEKPARGAMLRFDGKYIADTPLGQGVTDLPACRQALRQYGYNGAVALETHGPDDYLTEALAYMKNWAK